MTGQWEWTTLREVLVPQPNKKPLQQGWSPKCIPSPSPDSETWGVLKTTAIQPGRFDETQNKELPATLAPRPAIEVQQGDLLMTCAGPRSRCGIPALVRSTRPRLMMSGKMYRFRPVEGVDSAFLEKWLLSAEAQARIDAMKTGISDSGLNLTQDRFLALPVPMPGMEEQRRIVDIVEEHFARLDVAEGSLDVADKRLEGLVESAIQLCLDWGSVRQVELRSLLAEPLANGRSVPTREGGFPVIRLTAIREGWVDPLQRKGGDWSRNDAKKWLIRPGDFLLSRGNGSLGLVGRGGLVLDDPGEVAFPDTIVRLRPNREKIDLDYLSMLWNSRLVRRQIESRVRTTAGIYKINQEALKSIEIPVPSLEVQGRLASSIGGVRLAGRRIAGVVEAERRRTAALRRAILTAAFAGRLSGRSTDTEVIEELVASR